MKRLAILFAVGLVFGVLAVAGPFFAATADHHAGAEAAHHSHGQVAAVADSQTCLADLLCCLKMKSHCSVDTIASLSQPAPVFAFINAETSLVREDLMAGLFLEPSTPPPRI